MLNYQRARLKHFGAAASSSGGVEMYHLVGVTPEANPTSASLDANARRESVEATAEIAENAETDSLCDLRVLGVAF